MRVRSTVCLNSATSSPTTTSILTGSFQAGITTLAEQAAVWFYKNGGDLSKVFEELGSSQSIRNVATAMATAGALAEMGLNPTGQATANSGQQQFIDQLTRNVKADAATTLTKTAINDSSLADKLTDSLKSMFLNTLAAKTANAIAT